MTARESHQNILVMEPRNETVSLILTIFRLKQIVLLYNGDSDPYLQTLLLDNGLLNNVPHDAITYRSQ